MSTFQVDEDLPLDLSFLDQTTPSLTSLLHPPSDFDNAATHSIVSHFLNLDLLSLSTNHKNALCVALVVLVSTSQVPESKVFISKALGQTSSIFPSMDRALKPNMEISSKMYA